MKISQLKSILKNRHLDFALFCNLEEFNPNMYYLSSYGGLGILIVPQKKSPFLIVPEMECQRAKKTGMGVYTMDKKKFFESINNILNKNKIKKNSIAIDASSFTLNFFKYFKKSFRKSKTKDLSKDCLNLRKLKTKKEIGFLKKSCHYASTILDNAISNFKDFKTESQMAAFLEYETKKNGLGISFPPIVASGSNGSMPHYQPRNIKLKDGFCVIDCGVKYKGYCSDITRTVFVGKPNKKEKQIYNFLLGVQENIIKDININDNCGKTVEKCMESLKGYAKYFIHGLGHGVGVEIHELPNFKIDSRDKVEKNIVFTIEPGIYLPKKFGIRIEDTILMGDKPLVLTKVSKDLLTV